MFWDVSAVTPTTACKIRLRNACKNKTRLWPFCFGAVLASFRSQMHHLRIQLDPFRTLKVHGDSVNQGLYIPLRMWGENVFIFNEKQHRTLAFLFRDGLGLFRSQMHPLGIKLDPFRILKIHFECVFQCLYLTPAFAVESVSFCNAKTAQDAGQFFVLHFWPLFVPKCTFSRSNLTHLTL